MCVISAKQYTNTRRHGNEYYALGGNFNIWRAPVEEEAGCRAEFHAQHGNRSTRAIQRFAMAREVVLFEDET